MIKYSIVLVLFSSISFTAEYKSQAGQDQFVNENFFHNRKSGFFLDIGAHDGQTFSNTWFFEKELGWKGICFEPIPKLFGQLKGCRNCICINACVSDTNDTLPFLHVDSCDEMLSGLCGTFSQTKLNAVLNDLAQFGGELKVIQVPCVRLEEILEHHNVTHIDYLSLDVEGHELEVLKTIDFSKVTIDVITVENDYDNEAIRDLLIANGFIMVGRVHVDDVFARLEFIS